MSFEEVLVPLLSGICPRTYPDVAPAEVVEPYITWQAIGGESVRFGDNTAPDKRNALVQINVWSKTRKESTLLIRQVEDAICASDGWQASPQGEPRSDYEADTKRYGSLQTFDIWASR